MILALKMLDVYFCTKWIKFEEVQPDFIVDFSNEDHVIGTQVDFIFILILSKSAQFIAIIVLHKVSDLLDVDEVQEFLVFWQIKDY